MSSCALTQDYNIGCAVGQGGLKEIYLIELDNISALVESSGTLTTITKATGKVFRKYQLVRETSSADETITGNVQNGTCFYAQKVTLVINYQNVAVRNEILLLAVNRLAVVATDNNGTYRLFGRIFGLRLIGGTANSGTAWGDRNGYTLEFTGDETQLAPFVDPSVIATLQTPG